MNFKFYKNKIIAGLINGLITSLVIFIISLLAGNSFRLIHLDFADGLYTKLNPSEDIVIITIDDDSVKPPPEGLGRYAQWSRERYARLLQQLESASPKVIAFDILYGTEAQIIEIDEVKSFIEEIGRNELTSAKDLLAAYQEKIKNWSDSSSNIGDQNFAEQIEKLGNIILAGQILGENDSRLPIEKFSENATIGIVSAEEDPDGIIRNMKLNYELNGTSYNHFSVEVAKKFLGLESLESLEIPDNENLLINFFSKPSVYTPENPTTFKKLKFVNVHDGIKFDPEDVRDKIVLIGVTSAGELQDIHPTPRIGSLPLGKGELLETNKMSGIEIHANAIQTILEKDFLMNQSRVALGLTIILVSITLCITLNYLNVTFSIIFAVVSLLSYWLSAKLFFNNGVILNMVYPFIAIILSYLAAWAYKYFIANKSQREITKAFSHYVSKKLVDQISKNPDMVKLGGEKRDVTVFFSDIKNSTTWSEKVEITSWVSQVSEYFTVMEGIMKKYGGTVDKYEGDAMMGFWNAPIEQKDHVYRGYLTAIEMRIALKNLHQKWQLEGKPLIEFRIGLNTGEAIVGNFGSATRFDYTVMGDTVNVASRLESSANKSYNTHICVSGFMNHLTPEQLNKFVFRELDRVVLPGKKDPLQIFELVCLSQNLTNEAQAVISNYQIGLQEYRNKNFQAAFENFNKNPNDPPSKVMAERCQKIISGQQIPNIDQNMIFYIQNK